MDFACDVGVGGSGERISAGHAAIADGGKQHGEHGDENSGDDMAAAGVAHGAEGRHGRGGLHHDDAHDEQLREAEGARELGRRVGGGSGHRRLLCQR